MSLGVGGSALDHDASVCSSARSAGLEVTAAHILVELEIGSERGRGSGGEFKEDVFEAVGEHAGKVAMPSPAMTRRAEFAVFASFAW